MDFRCVSLPRADRVRRVKSIVHGLAGIQAEFEVMDDDQASVEVPGSLITAHTTRVSLTAGVPGSNEECCVCQTSDDAPIPRMPCGHSVHDECIRPWLAQGDTCPVCRAPLPIECTVTWVHNGPIVSNPVRLPAYLTGVSSDDDDDDSDEDEIPDEGGMERPARFRAANLIRRALSDVGGGMSGDVAAENEMETEWGSNHGVVIYASDSAHITIHMP